jgi:hypothetical protein
MQLLASVAHEASLPRSSPADDLRTTVAGQVDEEARVIDTPALSVVAEISDDLLECWEGTVAVVEGDPDPSISEADDETRRPCRARCPIEWRP